MPAIRGGIIDAHISPLGGASQQKVKVDDVILKTASTMVGRLISFWYSCGAGREDEVMMRDSRASEMCFTFMLLLRWLGAALGEDEIARWAIDAAAAAICAFIVDPAWFAPTWTANAPAEQVCRPTRVEFNSRCAERGEALEKMNRSRCISSQCKLQA